MVPQVIVKIFSLSQCLLFVPTAISSKCLAAFSPSLTDPALKVFAALKVMLHRKDGISVLMQWFCLGNINYQNALRNLSESRLLYKV